MREQTTTDDRAQTDVRRGVQVMVALALIGLLSAVMIPVAVNALVDDNSVSFTDVSEGDTNEVISGSLNVTLDNTAGTDTNISVTLTDVDSGNTLALINISQGSSQNGTLEGETLTVTADNVKASTADFTVDHPPDYAWGSGAKSIWGIIDLIIVLVVLLFAIGLGMLQFRT